MEAMFTPIENANHKEIYQKCVGKSVYYLNIIALCSFVIFAIISHVDFLKAPLDVLPTLCAYGLMAIVFYYWIAPSGIIRVYNKSHGSRTASSIASIICIWLLPIGGVPVGIWLGIIGWIICWTYEKWK
jgi:TM2 domain-containing membrane protein YozV